MTTTSRLAPAALGMKLRAGDTAFSFIGTAYDPFTAAGQVCWLPGETDTYILLNTDGDAAIDGVIRVLGVHEVDASWFVL